MVNKILIALSIALVIPGLILLLNAIRKYQQSHPITKNVIRLVFTVTGLVILELKFNVMSDIAIFIISNNYRTILLTISIIIIVFIMAKYKVARKVLIDFVIFVVIALNIAELYGHNIIFLSKFTKTIMIIVTLLAKWGTD